MSETTVTYLVEELFWSLRVEFKVFQRIFVVIKNAYWNFNIFYSNL